MRTASGLVKDHHALTVSILLIVAVLAIGILACNGAAARTCQLTISSTSGGNVTTPGEGTFPYPAGTVIQLVATPDDGYQFRTWTGDVANLANLNAASTTITMNGDYAILANFGTEGGTSPGNGGHNQP